MDNIHQDPIREHYRGPCLQRREEHRVRCCSGKYPQHQRPLWSRPDRATENKNLRETLEIGCRRYRWKDNISGGHPMRPFFVPTTTAPQYGSRRSDLRKMQENGHLRSSKWNRPKRPNAEEVRGEKWSSPEMGGRRFDLRKTLEKRW